MKQIVYALIFLIGFPFVALAEDKPGAAADAELVETRREVPKLKAPSAYEPKNNIVDIELSNYAGYAGLIVANGGLEPNENSIFFKKHGFKVHIALSEEESWNSLNAGKMAASATTADVLAVYGKQFDVVVPALIGFSRGADGVVVRSSVKRINDLKGKVLATCQFTESDFLIRYLASEAGIDVNLLDDLAANPDPDSLNLVMCADGFGAGDLFLRDLKAGRNRLAGCVTWAPKTTDVVKDSNGRAKILVTNRNLLIVADILIVNRGFATAHPDMVKGLVEGLITGNQMVRANPGTYLPLISKYLKWNPSEAAGELAKVHLANLPENISFFDGTIDSAGSYGFIFESAVSSYGKNMIPSPSDSDYFLDLSAIKEMQKSGLYAAQVAQVVPIKSENVGPETEPLLSKNIRFVFQPNSSKLELQNKQNLAALDNFSHLLQISPGSTILLRGHADPSLIEKFRDQGGEALVRKVALTAMQLSKDRAGEVAKLLIEKYKVDPSRVKAVGRGWEEPISDKPEENRRVELQWFTLQ